MRRKRGAGRVGEAVRERGERKHLARGLVDDRVLVKTSQLQRSVRGILPLSGRRVRARGHDGG